MKTIKSYLAIFGCLGLALCFNACDPEELAQDTFPHLPHVEQELGCVLCHEFNEETVSMPSIETCAMCHEPEDEVYFGKCMECHNQHGIDPALDVPINHRVLLPDSAMAGWEDVKYKHAVYLNEDTDCQACHTEIAESEHSSLENLPTMEVAMNVHDEWDLSNDCNVCHLRLSPMDAPLSHEGSWDEWHGHQVEFMDKSRCLLCHEEATCEVCHATEQPRDHTNLFRRKTHGIHVTFDRDRCLTCHRNDECESCHRAAAGVVPPQPFHVPGASCLSCHSPLAAQGPKPRPRPEFLKPMPHRMMMGATSQTCLECHTL